ncbi:hypothetical protein [Silvanigrella aquatica]|uniref:DUF3352 domain-containing protein n=1 Tax=Silvanigrella aquatica TaxID=1915309 RepID=A0A1L4CXB4_9BACT|nr:hypothetical protein [Silvanigrella aquatica]APJ02593.1 hypothetical protein AXG55_01045 [Silvanigrella aquatica]
MKRHSNFIKFIFIVISFLITVTFVTLIFLYQNLKSETPPLSSLAKRIGKPAFAVAFNYTANTDRQLYEFSKNIGLENNPRTQQSLPPLGDVGARGFFIFDLQPQYSDKSFETLENILNDFLTSSESSIENEFFDPSPIKNEIYDKIIFPDEVPLASIQSDKPPELTAEEEGSPFAQPLTSLIEELWNGKTILFGGSTQLQLSLKDSILLAIEPNLKKSFHLSSSTLKSLIFKNAPLSIQKFLTDHSIEISSEAMEYDAENKINYSQIIISINDPVEFLNSICSQKINPWDFCGRFSIHRNNFRKNVESILSLLNNNFKIKLDMFWSIQGENFVFSNQKTFVTKVTSNSTPTDSNNILTTVSSSGADFLLPTESTKNYSSVSFLFDMILAQNKIIDFSERLRKKSAILSDFFASPSGEIIFSNFENTINKLTGYSENASLTLDTDGEKLIPKIRLYSPSGDLFTHDGKELNPETLNTIRIFITKAISFGNYLLPRGLIPMPGPYIQRNGKWVIIQSEIPVKLIAPYLESVDPYIDTYEDPTKL